MKRFNNSYNKSDVEKYLSLLSKEIKRQFGRKAKVELIIVGGAAILLGYDFRDNTMDIDAYISNGVSIKPAIYKIAEDNDISEDWLNSDFLKTTSFTHKLTEVSKFFKTYNQSLSVRVVKDEYLIAMKLESFRKYKFDLSDVVNIFYSMKGSRKEKIEKIKKAFKYLYDKSITGERLNYLNKISEKDIDANKVRKYENLNARVIKEIDKNKRVSKSNLDKVLADIDKIEE